MRSLLALLLCAGCGGPLGSAGGGVSAPPGKPGQDLALAIVWSGVFEADDEPPPIEWRSDNCGGPEAGVRHEGRCYAGLYLRDDRALIAWRGSFHASAFAHELLHALQWRGGLEDPDHKRADWKRVKEANRELEKAGL